MKSKAIFILLICAFCITATYTGIAALTNNVAYAESNNTGPAFNESKSPRDDRLGNYDFNATIAPSYDYENSYLEMVNPPFPITRGNIINFRLELSNPNFANLDTYRYNDVWGNNKPLRKTWWGALQTCTSYNYAISLYRVDNAGEQHLLTRIDISYTYTGENDYYRNTKVASASYFSDMLLIGGQAQDHFEDTNGEDVFEDNGDVLGMVDNSSLGVAVLPISILTDDPMANYQLSFEYSFNRLVTHVAMFEQTERSFSSKVYSDVVSAYGLVINDEQNGYTKFEEHKDDLIVKYVLSFAYQDVIIKYLQQIGETDFAEMVAKKISIRLPAEFSVGEADRAIHLNAESVLAALGLESFTVLSSTFYQFVEEDPIDGVSVFRVEYASNSFIRAFDVEGNVCDSYLSVNNTFDEAFGAELYGSVIPEGAYTFFLNKIRLAHPDLNAEKYPANSFYGDFIVVVIPQGYTLDAWWDEFLDKDTTGLETMMVHRFDGYLTKENYDRLCDDFGMSWLSKTWNNIAALFDTGSAPASFYMIYSKSYDESHFIGENGAEDIEDSSGSINDSVDDTIEDIGDSLGGLFAGDSTFLYLIFGLIGIWLLLKVLNVVVSIVQNLNKKKK